MMIFVITLEILALEIKNKLVNVYARSIRLILGNHDNHPVKWYLDCGFDRVYDKSIIVQEKYILSHCPIEFSSNLGPFKNIHGHVHNDADYLIPTRQRLNVSCEVLNYIPITIEEAIKRMESVK